MKIDFRSSLNAGMTFAAGPTYENAETGATLFNVAGSKLTIPYPNALFITFHNTGDDGDLFFTHSYLDREPEDAIDFSGAKFVLIEPFKFIEEEADLMSIYVLAVLIGISLVFAIFCIWRACVFEKRTNEEAEQ